MYYLDNLLFSVFHKSDESNIERVLLKEILKREDVISMYAFSSKKVMVKIKDVYSILRKESKNTCILLNNSINKEKSDGLNLFSDKSFFSKNYKNLLETNEAIDIVSFEKNASEEEKQLLSKIFISSNLELNINNLILNKVDLLGRLWSLLDFLKKEGLEQIELRMSSIFFNIKNKASYSFSLFGSSKNSYFLMPEDPEYLFDKKFKEISLMKEILSMKEDLEIIGFKTQKEDLFLRTEKVSSFLEKDGSLKDKNSLKYITFYALVTNETNI